MTVLNRVLTAVLDELFAPLGRLSPSVGLAVVALVTAAGALTVVKLTSNQAGLRQAKDGMYAALLEMRLFNDDLGAIWRAQLDVFRFNLRYLRVALVPVLWLVVPLGLAVAHLEAFYGYNGLAPDRPALVTAHVRPGAAINTPVTLDAPAGIRVETPALWFPSTRNVVWRIVPDRATSGLLRIRAGSESVTKTVVVSENVGRRSVLRASASWQGEIENPSETPLPTGSVFDAISVSYPARDLTAFGWHISWLVDYGGLTIVFGLILSRLFGVEV